jgi:hypothetical protein
MRNLAPPRQFFERMKGHITVRAQLPELSDWSLRILVSFAKSPVSTQLSRSGWPDDPFDNGSVSQLIIPQPFISTHG